MTEQLGPTPSQTVGPYLSIVLPWPDGPDVVAADHPGAITLRGRLIDGAGMPVPDGLIEIWQPDEQGRFNAADFRGFGRCPTDADGWFWFRTVRPGPVPAEDGAMQAPHVDVSVFARGLLHRLVTRIYLPDEAANDADPVLCSVAVDRRGDLVAVPEADGMLRFDIRLQGAAETPFFAI